MVGGLHSVCVLLNLAQTMVMPKGIAGLFPEGSQGRTFVLGSGPNLGLLVVLVGRTGEASLSI
jgi:hypothetical protein